MTAPISHSPLYDYLLGMYLRGTLTEAALDAAVAKGKLRPDEAAEIRAAKAARDAAIIAEADSVIASELTS